jgi:3D (Asp-Asp-Asp) domain-containing protein
MHKTVGLLLASNLIAYSVLVPLVANAQTVSASVSTSSVNIESMTTAPVSTVQGTTSTTPSGLLPASKYLPTSGGILPASDIPAASTFLVTLTSYNAVPEQTSPTPWLTASGAASNPEVVAARSHDLADKLPYGTIIAVLGPTSSDNGPYCGYDSVQHLIGYRVIADQMNARMHNKVDIQLDQNDTVSVGGKQINPAKVLGACTGVQIQVVGYVNPNHIPTTQAALAKLVNGSKQIASTQF